MRTRNNKNRVNGTRKKATDVRVAMRYGARYLALRVRTGSSLVARTYQPIRAVSTVNEEGRSRPNFASEITISHGISVQRSIGMSDI